GEEGTEFGSREDLCCRGSRDGRLVQWEDAWLATRRSGFDSPAGPLSVEGSWMVAGDRCAGPPCQSGFGAGSEGSTPRLPLPCPGCETDHHPSLLTRCSGFESWPGRCWRPSRIRSPRPAARTPFGCG